MNMVFGEFTQKFHKNTNQGDRTSSTPRVQVKTCEWRFDSFPNFLFLCTHSTNILVWHVRFFFLAKHGTGSIAWVFVLQNISWGYFMQSISFRCCSATLFLCLHFVVKPWICCAFRWDILAACVWLPTCGHKKSPSGLLLLMRNGKVFGQLQEMLRSEKNLGSLVSHKNC